PTPLRNLYHPLLASEHLATARTHTLSLHDALPISLQLRARDGPSLGEVPDPHRHGAALGDPVSEQQGRHLQHRSRGADHAAQDLDRKSTRLNSSHVKISYAVFCLKKKKWGKRNL